MTTFKENASQSETTWIAADMRTGMDMGTGLRRVGMLGGGGWLQRGPGFGPSTLDAESGSMAIDFPA